MDLQVGGVSKFKVGKDGAATFTGNVNASNIVFNALGGGIYIPGGGNFLTLNASLASTVGGLSIGNGNAIILGEAANTLAQRNGVNAQTFRLYNTFTDASNYERTEFFWSSNLAGLALTNAGTGSARSSFRIVGGSTIDFQISAPTDNNTAINFRHSSTLSVSGTSVSYVGRISGHRGFFDGGGVVALAIPSGATDRWAFFGTTSSFPSLKRDTVRLQARLADDSAFTNIQGKLTTEANAVSETVVATHTLTIYDAAGTGYKVLAVAA
jgi:hypothetical protein